MLESHVVVYPTVLSHITDGAFSDQMEQNIVHNFLPVLGNRFKILYLFPNTGEKYFEKNIEAL